LKWQSDVVALFHIQLTYDKVPLETSQGWFSLSSQ
jgi:hypothetical protein